MMLPLRIATALALGACIAGCAAPGTELPSAIVTSPRAKVIAPERSNVVSIGRSTRADVLAALGETLVINFDTGYEVWIYRLARTRDGEFVILFTPSGVVAKTRLRSG
jgi:hypothetical protein